MYVSWRTRKSIALTESVDGFSWERPKIVLPPDPKTGWEDNICRPSVLIKNGKYYMWYSPTTEGKLDDNSGGSVIGCTTSSDGVTWDRLHKPVMEADQEWEKGCVMCPHVNWNKEKKIFQMYYSAGGWYEPEAIGYAESVDGIVWTKHHGAIFGPVYKNLWERERVTACQVIHHKDWYYMFYIGFEDIHKARVCAARSKDGITNWQRHPLNPLICPGASNPQREWDCDAVYKPFVVWEEKNNRWIMWANGRNELVEQIGVFIHQGEDFGFDDPIPKTEYE
jgi:sucrose-6-phosphate hydrolase SacC (GH32 family)